MHSPLLFDLPSLQPLLLLSLGFGCEEASLSLMTVDSLPARPPLCPQLTQLSLETEDQRSGEVSQADPLRQNNNQQKHFSPMSTVWIRIPSSIPLCHQLTVFHFYFIVASGNVAQKTMKQIWTFSFTMHIMSCLYFPRRDTDWNKRGKKNAYRVIITALRAHRGYASFNFTLYSLLFLTHLLSLSLPLYRSFSPLFLFSFFLHNPLRQC